MNKIETCKTSGFDDYRVLENALNTDDYSLIVRSPNFQTLRILISNAYSDYKSFDHQYIDNYSSSISNLLKHRLNMRNSGEYLNYYKIDNLCSIVYTHGGNFYIHYPYIVLNSTDFGNICREISNIPFSQMSNTSFTRVDFIPVGWKIVCYKNRHGYDVEYENITLDSAIEYNDKCHTQYKDYLFFANNYFNTISYIKTNKDDEYSDFIPQTTTNIERLHKYLDMLKNIRLSKSQVIIILRSIIGSLENSNVHSIADKSRVVKGYSPNL